MANNFERAYADYDQARRAHSDNKAAMDAARAELAAIDGGKWSDLWQHGGKTDETPPAEAVFARAEPDAAQEKDLGIPQSIGEARDRAALLGGEVDRRGFARRGGAGSRGLRAS